MHSFWSGKRVLLTGHTGFKGAWLAIWLHRLGAQVRGVALEPATEPNLFALAGVGELLDSHYGDLRDAQGLARQVQDWQPQVVFHLAAAALVRQSYDQPLQTFATNTMGTANLLEALRLHPGARVAVMVTTDKVYRNTHQFYPYRENDALGGHDPYSASKAASELVIASYRQAFLAQQGLAVASARAGNVIGGGDWAADRLIPDCMRALHSGTALVLRNPGAVRPWQHVLEPLHGYLQLAQALWQRPELADAYNLGPATHEVATVGHVVKMALGPRAADLVSYENNSDSLAETHWLAVEPAKARAVLGLRARWGLETALQRTVRWYSAQAQGAGARSLCLADLDAFEATA